MMRAIKIFFTGLVFIALIPTVVLIWFKFVNPDTKRWVDLDNVSHEARIMVLASEDNNYCSHNGFDVDSIRFQLERMRDGERPSGGSSISQQTVKNLLLWNDRSWMRKALEAFITPQAEFILGKRRMFEIYLNIVDFGQGRIGIEEAAQWFFKKPASQLSFSEGAKLAVALPAPSLRNPAALSVTLAQQAARVERRSAYMVGQLSACVM